MRSAAAAVADRFHTDAQPDTLVSPAIPGKEEFVLSSSCQSARLSSFLSLLFGTTKLRQRRLRNLYLQNHITTQVRNTATPTASGL
jgi:hypothetical protein